MDGSIVVVGEINLNNFFLSLGIGNVNGIDGFVIELLIFFGEIGVFKIIGGN